MISIFDNPNSSKISIVLCPKGYGGVSGEWFFSLLTRNGNVGTFKFISSKE
ncbi:MAG: hypothetical protein ACKVHI_07615 [Candidatus Puniceispirillales bacterium]